jgi:molybdenum cofactor cytidylyltransferase
VSRDEDDRAPHFSAVCLAAGEASRFGADKLAAPFRGRPLLQWAVQPLLECPRLDEVIVVVRPGFVLPFDAPGCVMVENPAAREGLSTSLCAGILATHESADAYVVALGDMPLLTVVLVERLLTAFEECGKRILVPVHAGRRGHPVIISRSCREGLLAIRGDVGARGLIGEHPDWVAYEPVAAASVVFDVDEVADLERGGGN